MDWYIVTRDILCYLESYYRQEHSWQENGKGNIPAANIPASFFDGWKCFVNVRS
jgi:hypothetical protein